MKASILNNIKNEWPKLSRVVHVPHTEKEYKKLVKHLDKLIDEVGNDEKHPLASLMETIGVLVSSYEKVHFPVREAGGIEVLKYLMEEQNLKQSDLSEIGSQGVVSEILSGKRDLNLRQIKNLAKKFSVSPSVFI